MTPTIHDLAAQAEWEMEGVRRAIARYEEIEFGRPATDTEPARPPADPATLPPGKALIRGVVGPLIKAIEQLRDDTADALRQPGRQPVFAWILQTIDPQKAAVVVLNAACTSTQSVRSGAAGANSVSTIPMVAKRIAAALRDQLEYDRWEAAEQQRNKEAARSKVQGHENRLKALQLRYPNLDRRVWAKWRAKLELAREAAWTEEEQVGIGCALIHLLVQTAPDRFVLDERPMNGGVQYFLNTTPEVREVLNDVRERAMVARPLLMPMICPPLPWRYADDAK